MTSALIVAPGLDSYLAEFLITKLSPEHIAFLATDATVSMIPSLCEKLALTSHKICFIKDIFSTSETIQEVLNAFQWLRAKEGIETIYVDATNCITVVEMSAYLSASLLDLYRDVLGFSAQIKLMYTHCEFAPLGDGRFIEVRGTEELIELERPVDALGFVLIVEGVNAFNRGRYHQAVSSFTAAANAATGEKCLFYSGLLELAAGYESWDRLNYLEASSKLKSARSSLLKAKCFPSASWLVPLIDRNLWALTQLQEGSQPHVVVDLFQNATRRFNEGRYDDAMARLYACLERMIQKRLSSLGIDTGKPDYKQVPESVIQEFTKQCGGTLPGELELRKGCLLLSLCDDPLSIPLQEIGMKTVTGLIGIRNHSILAHGLKPVDPEQTLKFNQRLVSPILSVFISSASLSEHDTSAFTHLTIPAVEDLLHRASTGTRAVSRVTSPLQ